MCIASGSMAVHAKTRLMRTARERVDVLGKCTNFAENNRGDVPSWSLVQRARDLKSAHCWNAPVRADGPRTRGKPAMNSTTITPNNTVFIVVSFEGPDLKKKTIRIDAVYVQKMLADIVKDQDLSRYIL